MEDKRTELKGEKWGWKRRRKKSEFFCASLLDEGVKEKRGCKKEKEEEAGE